MHYISFLLMVLFVNISAVSAQITRNSYRINFEVDKADLDAADKAVLDQILSDYSKATYGELQLTAHTDADAADVYNMQLSRKRADAVMDYLCMQGVQRKRIAVQWFGERKPEKTNANEEGKAINRRVDIVLTNLSFNQVSDLIKLAGPEYKQSFTIDPTKDNTIKARNGTTIVIPKGSLVTRSGKPLSSNMVAVVIEEFLNPSDAAFQQLSTVSDGRILQSGGMFSVKAFAANEELELKQGKKLKVDMPSINMQQGMELFTASTNNEGIVEWKPTSQPFNPKGFKPAPAPFTKMDTKYLSSLKVDLPAFDAGDVLMTCELPAFPIAPRKPKLTYTYHAPTKQSMFAWYERWFIPDAVLDKKLEAEHMRLLKAANDAQSHYNQKMTLYQEAYSTYLNDSIAFEQKNLETLREWLRNQRSQHEAYVKFIETKQWNQALTNLITASDNNTLTFASPRTRFVQWLQPRSLDNTNCASHKLAIKRIDYLLTQSMTSLVTDHSKGGVLTLDMSRWSVDNVNLYLNETAMLKLNNDATLQKMFAKAQEDILEKRQKAGLVDKDIVGNIYSTTVSNLGMFNCDRFDETPPSQMATIDILYNGDARVSFFFPEANSYLYASKTNKGYTARLPRNQEVKVVFVAFNKEKGPMLSIKKASFTQDTRYNPEAKPVSLVELQKGLTSL